LKIFVADYKNRHSQVIIKALQNEGFEVYSFINKKIEEFIFNIKGIDCKEEDNIDNIIKCLKQKQINIVLPITLDNYRFYSRNKKKLIENNIKTLISNYDAWDLLNDKNKSSVLADQLQIPIPKTILLSKNNFLDEINKNLDYKVVIKSVEEGGARFVRYANNDSEVKGIIEEFIENKNNIFENGIIAQEYIMGISCAYFCIANEGKIYDEFSHIRIRENPPSGGVSSACKSFSHKKLFAYGRKIIQHVKYTGVCMVEFKYDINKDEFYLIEINPKFWGSVMLPIVAGVNFPKEYIDILTNNHNMEYDKPNYKNIKVQFVLSDLSRVLKYKINIKDFWIDFFNPKVKKDIFYLGIFRYLKYYIGKNYV